MLTRKTKGVILQYQMKERGDYMKQFKIVPLEGKEYDIIVFSQSYESPFSCLDEITKEIREYNISNAKILFDTLLSSGNTNERFAEAVYSNENFIAGSFQFVNISKKDYLRKYCAEYFCENKDILEYSILTPIQKKMLSKGFTI